MRPCLSPLGEEISQDGLTLAFQHAAVHFRTMADMRIARNIPNRTACTELGIPGTERDGADMGLAMQAPAHIGHGSSVTASVQSARFQERPKAWAA